MKEKTTIFSVVFLLLFVLGCDENGDDHVDMSAEEDTSRPCREHITYTTPVVSEEPPFAIAWPDRSEDYAPQSLFALESVVIPQDSHACCFDFGEGSGFGDDNSHSGTVAILVRDTQQTWDAMIANGELRWLFDLRENTAGEPSAVLSFLKGTPANDGSIAEESFQDGRGVPQTIFNPIVRSNDGVIAGPVPSVVIDFPLGGHLLKDVILRDVIFESDHLSPGASVLSGTLSAYILRDDIIDALNQFASSSECDCLQLSGDLYTWDDVEKKVVSQCENVNINDCRTADQCGLFSTPTRTEILDQVFESNYCVNIGDLFLIALDLDIEAGLCTENERYEAMTLGIELTAHSTP